MGVWVLDADVLAASRFAVSPLAETHAALASSTSGAPAPWQRPWYDTHAAAVAARVAADPFASALLHQVLGRGWLPDFMARPPLGAEDTIEEELARVAGTAREVALADLAVPLAPQPLPAAVVTADPAADAADLLWWVWAHTLAEDWNRRRHRLHADVVHRAARQARHGWAAALDDLGPRVRWLGDGRLQINDTTRPARDLTGAELVLVPSATTRSWVCWDLPERYALVYPAAGQLLDVEGGRAPAAVRALLGPTRADLLAALTQPASPTQLAARTGLALGTVGHHLRVLHDTGAVLRRRAGASVLYYRSPLGDHVVDPRGPVAGARGPAAGAAELEEPW